MPKALMNNEYRTLDKKIHHDSSSDILMVWGIYRNKNQDGQERSHFISKKKYSKRMGVLIIKKGPLEETLSQLSQK